MNTLSLPSFPLQFCQHTSVADNLQKNIEKDLKVTNSDFKPPKAKTEVNSEPQQETTQADLYGDPLTQADNELRF